MDADTQQQWGFPSIGVYIALSSIDVGQRIAAGVNYR